MAEEVNHEVTALAEELFIDDGWQWGGEIKLAFFPFPFFSP